MDKQDEYCVDANDQISVIEAITCLGDLPLNQLSELIEVLQPRRVPARQAVYREGEEANLLFFVGTGHLLRLDGEHFSAHLVRGMIAGWDSFFHRCPRDHTLIAEKDSLIYALNRHDLDELSKRHPDFLSHFLTATTPLPSTASNQQTAGVNKQIGIFTFADLRAQARPIFDDMLSTISAATRAARYTCEDFCSLANLSGTTEDLYGPLASDVFAQLENEHDVVFFTATAEDPIAWIQKIAGQVDTLILVLRDDSSSIPSWFEELLKASSKTLGLVLVRTEAGDFDTRALAIWEVCKPDWHYRVHLSDRRRWASVARMALGRSVNLVLAGGGALGAMHCGILKTLEEHDFPIDTIGGTSVGACIAIGHALGFSADEVTEKFRSVFLERRAFQSYTLPFYSFINPSRFDRALRHIAEGKRLEESVLPVHATVTNLTHARQQVLNTGPVWEAMRMTGSLPALLPPFIRDGCAYVDGGVLNNFPISVARQKYAGHYIGVTFSMPTDALVKTQYLDRPGVLRTLLSRLGWVQQPDFPTIGEVIANSMMLSSTSGLKDAVNEVDELLHPPAPPHVGITSFSHFDELYEVGKQYAEEYVQRLEQSGRLNELRIFNYTAVASPETETETETEIELNHDT